ncbi:ABC-2 type transport system permease protein [Kitasatospora sp. SolWspMP-SS2h]|uniref:ABC transporter permease n=1 Tax=Kitasatospora sp. SolWspMP-SS2h TaxID=1305729 RepID=UPI000DB98CE9|nr:ABC transporter permease [Kitasatospora sp. SolWspMP-SS2h]RAJ29644.1 ABC-2 type transport system permease protein [Kitasatospora sp. SolWspMP-SS2h]
MTTPADAHSGVIHDIGYRPYTGPRLGRRYATRSLYVQSLRAAFGLGRSGKSKVLPFLLLGGMAAPALAMLAIALFAHLDEMPLDYADYLATFVVLPQIFLAAQAPVLMSRDLRHHVVPLYFSRPATRGDYVAAKFAAMSSALMIVLSTPLLLLFVGALLAKFPLGDNLLHLLYGLVAALLYALLYASLGLLIAAATPRRGFGVAAIMGVLMITRALASIVYALNGGLDPLRSDSAAWAFLISPSQLVEALANRLFGLGADSATVLHAPGAAGAAVFAAVLVALTAGGYALMLRRYRNV